MPQYLTSRQHHHAPHRGSPLRGQEQACYRFVTSRCLDEVTFSSLTYFQGSVERSTKLRLADPPCFSRIKRFMITLTAGGELVARQAWQPRWGTWRPNVGDGTVLRHPPGCPGQGIMTDLVFAPGQRTKCGWALASQGSAAHTGHHVVLLQTPAAAKTADTGVKLSADPSRVVTGIRPASHSHGVRLRCGRSVLGPTAPMAYERHLGVTSSGHRP